MINLPLTSEETLHIMDCNKECFFCQQLKKRLAQNVEEKEVKAINTKNASIIKPRAPPETMDEKYNQCLALYKSDKTITLNACLHKIFGYHGMQTRMTLCEILREQGIPIRIGRRGRTKNTTDFIFETKQKKELCVMCHQHPQLPNTGLCAGCEAESRRR